MRLPKLTLLQWLVFNELRDGERRTEALRSAVRRAGVAASVPAFQQLLGRLESAGYLRGRYERGMTGGRPVRYRVYRLTKAGRRAWEEVREFVCAA
jgi:DNA-binding PadR family transcriptional regulator